MFLIVHEPLKRHFTRKNINKCVKFIFFFFDLMNYDCIKTKKNQVKLFVFCRWLIVVVFTAIKSFYQRKNV